MRINLQLDTDDTDPPLTGWLAPRLTEAMSHAGVARGELTVLVLDDAAMGELHRQYHGDPAPTDVLTFDLRDAVDGVDPRAGVEGDLALGLGVAQRQAARRGHPVREELLLYAVHGLLHLLGEDDHDPEAFARMHAREDALLTAIGIGPRFAGGDEAGGDETEAKP